jgi:hypothetical protein
MCVVLPPKSQSQSTDLKQVLPLCVKVLCFSNIFRHVVEVIWTELVTTWLKTHANHVNVISIVAKKFH